MAYEYAARVATQTNKKVGYLSCSLLSGSNYGCEEEGSQAKVQHALFRTPNGGRPGLAVTLCAFPHKPFRRGSRA
eukprot:3347157-Rhodomonas_salina.2